ncbi:transposase family protein [Rhodopseudomonas pseudopalustris]|uniref:integrase catalytic domain-containing protein n=1 Tax=Rhodopseudomonas pseudopalustris TaxID=1513892 RepID=UPI003F97E994
MNHHQKFESPAMGLEWCIDMFLVAKPTGRINVIMVTDRETNAPIAIVERPNRSIEQVVDVLDDTALSIAGQYPSKIFFDAGWEYRSAVLADWCERHGVELYFHVSKRHPGEFHVTRS